MTDSRKIKDYLITLPEGQPFSSNALRNLATTENIRQILSRLVKAGELARVARGVFVKPKKLQAVGMVLPPVAEIAKALTQSTGETIIIHGAEAARQLELTTQVPMRQIFYTSGNTRTIKIANRTVDLIHVNPSRLVAPGTVSGLAYSALRYLGKENVTLETIEKIRQKISPEDFIALLDLVAQMPGWMADIFYRYQQGEKK